MWGLDGCQMTVNVCIVGMVIFLLGWLREKTLHQRMLKELKRLKEATIEQTSR